MARVQQLDGTLKNLLHHKEKYKEKIKKLRKEVQLEGCGDKQMNSKENKTKDLIKRDIEADTFDAMYTNFLTYGITYSELTGREQNMIMALAARYSDAIFEIVMRYRKRDNGKHNV